jgi:creatine kinase
MSTDSVYSHKAFVKASRADGGLEGRCKIPLLADRSGKISKKYGVFDAEEGIARKALVIIDDRGTARHMVASSLPVDKVIDDTLKVIQTFQSKSLGSGSGGDVQPSNFPIIKSKHSLVAKHVTKDKWEKLKNIKTKTSGFTLYKAIAVSVEFDNQHCGIYAGDWDSYKDFAIVFDPIIQEYHGILPSATHTSDMDSNKIKGNVDSDVPVHSCRIRVGRSIDGFGLSPGITKEQRKGVEALMKKAFANLKGDLQGTYYPLTGMDEKVRQKLVDDHFLFMSGDRNLQVAGMERDWPEGRGIYHNSAKTFLTWVNEEDQLRIISMQKGGDVKGVFERLARGIKAVQESVKKESGKDFMLDKKYGYVHSCPTNLGTGMRASVHVDLPGWTKVGLDALQRRCEELHLQPRGTRGESGGQTGHTYDISNKHRLGYSEVELVQKMIDGVNTLWKEDKAFMGGAAAPAAPAGGASSKSDGKYKAMPAETNGPFPNIQSKHSLVAKHVTQDKWEKLKGIKTKTSGFTLIQAIACAVEFDNQHCGIYAGDWDSYKDFAPVFDPIIQEYHGISAGSKHTSDMEVSKIKGNIDEDVPVHSCRIRVGRSIDGFGLSPGITKDQRLGVEKLMKNAVKNFPKDLAGQYYPLTGMNETVRQQLVDDHFLFVSGDRNLTVAGMERDWPEGRGIFHNDKKTFLIWVNEEDQLRIISMQMGGDVRGVFERLAKGIKAVGDSVKKESGKDFCLDAQYGYIHSCPTNLGTGMRASVHVDLPGWTKHGVDALKARCEELHLQPRGTRGESGGQTGFTYDISNKHRLGYSEVQLVQKMIDGVNVLWKEDKEYQKKYFGDFPFIASQHSLVAKHVNKEKWDKLKDIKTKTSGFTLAKAIACAVTFNNQHCGIYAGDWDSYKDFAPVFDPIIQEYHGISANSKHTSDMDVSKIKGNIAEDVPVHSCRIRVGRSIDGFGLSPGITKEQRVGVENLMKNAVQNFPSDLAGKYYPLTGMEESVRQQLVDDHFLFVSGDRNLTVAGMERDWPEGRGIFHNDKKTFLIWVNEEDQLRIISMQMGGDVRGVFERLAKGIKAVGDSVKKESGKDFCLDEKYGYIHSCPTNLGTGMRASVHVDLPGWTQHGVEKLKARCEELHLQPRGTRGESGGQTGFTYDISNKHRLGYSEVQLVQKMIDGVNTLWQEDKKWQKQYFGDFPFIASQHSLVAKHVTKEKWDALKNIKTKTSGFTLAKAIACAVTFNNQHCGIYAGDWDSYKDFAPVFDPLIQEYHGISASSKHTSDMDFTKITGNIVDGAPVKSTRIRVGRSIDGFGLSPGITKEQRVGVENLMKNAIQTFSGDLAGKYYPLTGMDEGVRQQLVDDHFLFMSGDRNLTVAGMERDWPEGRGIFHNDAKTFLIWINEEDQLRIISMENGGNVKGVFERLCNGIKMVQDSVKKESGKDFCLDEKYGYVHSCPTNLGTGMRASVHIDLPGWTRHSIDKLKARCEELHLQPRGTRGESGGQTGHTYDISNKHRLGYSEVQLVQKMIDGVNTLWKEDQEFQKKYNM